MNRRTLLAAGASAALAACATGRAAPRELSLAHEIDAAANGTIEALGVVPGFCLAVYSRDGVYTRGFGVTDVETREPVSADTAFYIASSTKPLTALALAAVAERGELNFEHTLAAYAPDAEFPAAVRPDEVKLRDLLTHTHGIENDAIVARTAFSGQHDPDTLWRLLASSSANTDAPLGTFDYTNVGYNIATILTDRKLGVRWQDLLQREVFGPAGMTRSTAAMSQARDWSLARPHVSVLRGGPQRIYLQKTDRTMQSAGGVIMSANDAARWLEIMVEDGRLRGRQVIPATAVQATRGQIAQVGGEFEGYRRDAYGLGWYSGPYRDAALYHHFGSFAGFRAHVSYIPAQGVGVAAFVNDSSATFPLPDAIANYVYDRVLGHGDAETRLDAAIAAMVRARDQGIERIEADRANRASRPWLLSRPRPAYAGVYENDLYGVIEVHIEGEALIVRMGAMHAVAEPFTRPDSIRVELVPMSGSPILFVGEGAAPEALLHQNQRFVRRV